MEGGDEAAMFFCPTCGIAYEAVGGQLSGFHPLTAAATTELAVGGEVQYLAVWRMTLRIDSTVTGTWASIARATVPGPVCLYVPAFTLVRGTVRRLATSLAEAQPVLLTTRGVAQDVSRGPSLVQVDTVSLPGSVGAALKGPDFGTFSPIVVGRADCRALAHFAFLAVDSREARDLCSVEANLDLGPEELVFLPAIWDQRYAHDSNWRLLLREFDGRVA